VKLTETNLHCVDCINEASYVTCESEKSFIQKETLLKTKLQATTIFMINFESSKKIRQIFNPSLFFHLFIHQEYQQPINKTIISVDASCV
jgi:hypothetical protein